MHLSGLLVGRYPPKNEIVGGTESWNVPYTQSDCCPDNDFDTPLNSHTLVEF